MKTNFQLSNILFICLLFLAGCGTEGSISNSSSISSPSGIVISASAVPQAVSSGGTSIITVTTLFNSSGAPATGATITAAIGSGGALDVTTATVDSTGLTVFTVTPTSAVSVTFIVEDVSVTLRINVVA